VDPELKIKDRMRLCLLASDLLSFNVDSAALSELPVCQNLPDLKTLPMVLGCLYVLEGSTLGGTIISKHLKKVLPIDESAGCSFFSSYGRDVGPMWSSFLAILSRHCEKFGDEEIVVKSACQTFAKMDCWLSNAG
jgi:heme oxygenase